MVVVAVVTHVPLLSGGCGSVILVCAWVFWNSVSRGLKYLGYQVKTRLSAKLDTVVEVEVIE